LNIEGAVHADDSIGTGQAGQSGPANRGWIPAPGRLNTDHDQIPIDTELMPNAGTSAISEEILMRMTRRILARVMAVAVLGVAFGMPVQTANAESAKLRLRVGEIDTSVRPNLIERTRRPAQFEPQRGYIVQIDGPMTPDKRNALLNAGVELDAYLPDQAYLVNLGQADPAKLAETPFVTWVGEYENAWKLDPEIGQRLGPFQTPERIALAAAGKLQLSVTLFSWADANAAEAELAQRGFDVRVKHEVGDQTVLGLVVDTIRYPELATVEGVQYVEESSEVTYRNDTTRWIVQSNQLDVTPLYDAGLRGEGQIVGVVDGRVDEGHCSFDDSVPVGPTHRKILAYNSTQGADDHGTHVAGTVVGDNGVDDDTRGIAYQGKLVFDTTPSFTESAILSVLNTHHGQGARVHTNSWGDDFTTAYNGLARGFDVFQYNNEESLVLLAVTNGSSLKNPENAKNLMAVGASQDTPSQANHCSGGVGPTADGRRKPEIYAPGCGTTSARWNTTCSTISFTGTSMACPAVAGVAMLVRQYYMDGYYPEGAPTPGDEFTPSAALVKSTLLNSTVDMTGVSGFPSNLEGWGRVLADNTLYFPGDTRTFLVLADIFNVNGLSTGESTNYPFSVSGSSEDLRMTLVFTDAPGASGSSNPVVNNLDLELTDPSGTVVYKGNVFSGGTSTTGGSADAINNVEQILIENPTTGLWTATVKGTAVNQGTQGYALVVSGEVNLGPLPPEAEDRDLETAVDQPIMVQLVAFDVDNDPLDYIISTLPADGDLFDPQAGAITGVPYTLANGGNLVQYVPDPGFVGSVQFTYRADDGGVPPDGGLSNVASVDILVKAGDPTILTSVLPDGAVDQAYGPVALGLSGGQPPVSWQIVADVPYLESDLGTSGFAEVGVAQGFNGDDQFWNYTLPFPFPFYNDTYTELRVWSNGFLNFGPHNGSGYNNSAALLVSNRRIAPLWDDLRTTGPGEDIFIDTSVLGEVTFRWYASTYVGGVVVNVAVTLHDDGAIDFHYGPGNGPVTPTIGVSDGDGVRNTLSVYNDQVDLGGFNSVRFKKPDQLSPGLTLSGGGVMSGTPAEAGAFLPVIRVTDSLNRTDQAAIPLLVRSIPGDIDLDGDVDADDLIVFTECLAGPMAQPPRVGPPPSAADCLATFDFNASGHVDLVDFASLQGAMTP
jgi:hypothetical protein